MPCPGIAAEVWALGAVLPPAVGSLHHQFSFSRGDDVESEKENLFRMCWGGRETGRGALKARRAHKESRSRKDFL